MAYFLVFGFLVCIFWSQLQTVQTSEKVCPNTISYIFGDKCYSLHTNDLNYNDAVHFCNEHNGTLWSKNNQEEVEFLRRLYVKITCPRWVAALEIDHSWTKYLNANFSIESKSVFNCMAIQNTDLSPKEVSCTNGCYTVCEYTDETCETRKREHKECYEFTDSMENFIGATNTCKSFGGVLVNVKNEIQIAKLRESIRRDKTFKFISEEQLSQSCHSGWLPKLWQNKSTSSSEELCISYEYNDSSMNDEISCEESSSFVCTFPAQDNLGEVTNQIIPTEVSQASSVPHEAPIARTLDNIESPSDIINYSTKTMQQVSDQQQTDQTIKYDTDSMKCSCEQYDIGKLCNDDICETKTTKMVLIVSVVLESIIIILGIIAEIYLNKKCRRNAQKRKRKAKKSNNHNHDLVPKNPSPQIMDPARRKQPAPDDTNIEQHNGYEALAQSDSDDSMHITTLKLNPL